MQGQRLVTTVGEDGFVRILTNQPKGARVEVVVVPLDEILPSPLSAVAPPAHVGFVNEVLGNAAEDVWNDL